MEGYRSIDLKGLKDGDLNDPRWSQYNLGKREYHYTRHRKNGHQTHREFLDSERFREICAMGGRAGHAGRLESGAYERLGRHNNFLALYRYARALIYMPSIFTYSDLEEHLTRRQWSRCKHSNLVIHIENDIYKKNEAEIDEILIYYNRFLKQND